MATNRSYPNMLTQKPASKSVLKEAKPKSSPWVKMGKKKE